MLVALIGRVFSAEWHAVNQYNYAVNLGTIGPEFADVKYLNVIANVTTTDEGDVTKSFYVPAQSYDNCSQSGYCSVIQGYVRDIYYDPAGDNNVNSGYSIVEAGIS